VNQDYNNYSPKQGNKWQTSRMQEKNNNNYSPEQDNTGQITGVTTDKNGCTTKQQK